MDSASAPVPRNSGRPPRGGDKEKEEKGSFKLKIPPTNRTTPYKEKFQALRERYDEVTKEHDNYQRDLDNAAAKIKMLQEENDLLLDAINVSSPNLINVVSPHQGLDSQQPTPDVPPRNTGVDNNLAGPRSSYLVPHPPHANGNANGRSNGTRQRPTELSDRESFVSEHGA